MCRPASGTASIILGCAIAMTSVAGLTATALPEAGTSGDDRAAESTTSHEIISEAALKEGRDLLRSMQFAQESFSFARVRWSGEAGRRGSSRWATDFPDADLALAARLSEWTSLRVGEGGTVVSLTDESLTDHAMLYLSEPGMLRLSPAEIAGLRKYLESGGFLMADDFWGESEWKNLRSQLQRVLPDSEFVDLPLGHQIFQQPFRLNLRPQVCSIAHAMAARESGITWERSDGKDVHYWGITDDSGRLMAVLCHNTDLADGWERAGDDAWYAQEFSEKRAFPMAMNIIVAAVGTKPN